MLLFYYDNSGGRIMNFKSIIYKILYGVQDSVELDIIQQEIQLKL